MSGMQVGGGTPLNGASAPDREIRSGGDERPASSAAGGHRRLSLIFAVMGVIVLVDQLTKLWAVTFLDPGVPVDVVGAWLRFNLVRNAGAAFSMGAGFTLVMSLIAIVVVVVIVRFARRIGSLWWALMLGALLGGAVGNLVDRLVQPPGLLRGHVVDFVQLPYWPVFNLADVAIVTAVGMMIVLAWRGIPLAGSGESESTAGEDR